MILNQKQEEAADIKNGAVAVVAGPGSGKTTVIANRVFRLIHKHNVRPEDILVITFSKNAADEMKQRFLAVSESDETTVMFSTFHSFFFRIIRRHMKYTLDSVVKEDEKYTLLAQIIKSIDSEFNESEDIVRDYINEISLVKNELIDIKYHNPINLSKEIFIEVSTKYEAWKEEKGKIDFDDMLTKCFDMLSANKDVLEYWQEKCKYIIIDEFQDINKTQYDVIKILAAKHGNIFVVGDDDQSIYRFRGSRPEFLLNFNKDFLKAATIILDINYRSNEAIINFANAIINENLTRITKKMRGTGKKIHLPVIVSNSTSKTEAAYIAGKIMKAAKKIKLSEIAVLYRTNMQSRALIDAFMDYGIPFFVRDDAASVYEHWITKDLLAYLSLAIDNFDNKACHRIINKPNRYMAKAIINKASNNRGSLLSNIYSAPNMQKWQLVRIEELMFYLKAIKARTPYDAIKYIYEGADYKDYLLKYAEHRQTDIKPLNNIYNEILVSAKEHETIEGFILHINAVVDKMKADTKNKAKLIKGENAVTLSTIHGVKGLEYDAVFIAGVTDGIIPYEKSKTVNEIEEERRLLYVAATRAKRYLFLSEIDLRNDVAQTRSPFLLNIDKNLYKGEISHEKISEKR